MIADSAVSPKTGLGGRFVTEMSVITESGGRGRVLWATTGAFFMSFVVWFDMAPFALAIHKSTGISKPQLAALVLCNLVLAMPGRVLAGKLLDRFGPRRLFAGLLVGVAVPNTVFALAHSFAVLAASRVVVGLAGAGFVLGIRLVSEWFGDDRIGAAEGFYGGWGNFGSAAAALGLPVVAAMIVGGPDAWRWGIGLAGVLSAAYGIFLFFAVSDAPPGRAYTRPKRAGALQVESKRGVFALIALQVPIVAMLGLAVYRLALGKVLSPGAAAVAYLLLGVWLGFETAQILSANGDVLKPGEVGTGRDGGVSTRLAVLAVCYAVSFGTELTMVALLPTYFGTMFGLKTVAAGLMGSMFAFTNLVTRPSGGIVSDLSGDRRKTLAVLLAGSVVIFGVMAAMGPHAPIAAVVVVIVLASVFIQGANGAVFAAVPGVRPDSTGQVAGMVGAYGNMGGLALASVLYFTATSSTIGDVQLVFGIIAVGALVAAAATIALLPGPAPLPALADPAPSGSSLAAISESGARL